MTNKYVPLISSSLDGPLGVMHLPRLWQKVSLEATGQLHPDYPGVGAGYDAMVLDALKIDVDAFKNFVSEKKPSYAECEKWVKENGTMCPVAIAKLNRQITQYHHADDTRKEILNAAGIEDDGSIPDAPNLNNLDDWQTFYEEVIKNA